MKQPFLSGIPLRLRLRVYFARHRKNVNENLRLIIALLAAAFAGWSGWEAHEARKDALLGVKIAQRSYIDVRATSLITKAPTTATATIRYSSMSIPLPHMEAAPLGTRRCCRGA